MKFLLDFLGLIFLFWGIGYLYRPSILLKINEWFRRHIFNDEIVVLKGKRNGMILFLLGLILLYWGLVK